MGQFPFGRGFDESWFAAILGGISDAVIATDDQGRVLFMNPVAETLTGWSQVDAGGRPVADVFNGINEDDRKPSANPVDTVRGSRRSVGIQKLALLIARCGKELPIEGSAVPVFGEDGGVTGVVLIFRDVAERRHLGLANERLAAIVESSDDIIASKNLDGIITSWNRGAERILGYTAEEVVGNHVSMLMPPELVEDMPRILERIKRGERVDHYQTRRQRKDGTIIDVALTVSPIRDASGTIIGASKIGRDITQEKHIEAERREMERQKDEFLAMLAHELRNPLSAISGAAQFFGRIESEEELTWAREVVLRQVGHLGRLIDDLLDVSRISRGKISLRKEAIDLFPIVGSVVESVRPLLEERKHELTVSLANGGLRLRADPLRLEQILINLLTNAAKYTDAGGKISLSARREGDEIHIAIRDDGMGIEHNLLPRIFDLFAQGDRSIARSEGGLGIGLTLVRKLVEMHGGTVSAASEGPGRGSEFTIRLPALAESSEPQSVERPKSSNVARPGSRVLVVDDSIDNATALSRLLTLWGHDVRTAHDGQESIEIARLHRPEIVLLDLGLPGMDGYEVVERLRGDDSCKDAIVIAVTGYGRPEDHRRTKEAGFDAHLVKPINYDELLNLFAPPKSRS